MTDPDLKLYTNYPDLFWVATARTGKAVGSIGYKHINSDTVDMHSFCVDNEFQKFGIGQKLIKTLVDTARENGYSTVTCYTGTANLGARKIYGKNNFEHTHTRNARTHWSVTYLTGIQSVEYKLCMK